MPQDVYRYAPRRYGASGRLLPRTTPLRCSRTRDASVLQTWTLMLLDSPHQQMIIEGDIRVQRANVTWALLISSTFCCHWCLRSLRDDPRWSDSVPVCRTVVNRMYSNGHILRISCVLCCILVPTCRSQPYRQAHIAARVKTSPLVWHFPPDPAPGVVFELAETPSKTTLRIWNL